MVGRSPTVTVPTGVPDAMPMSTDSAEDDSCRSALTSDEHVEVQYACAFEPVPSEVQVHAWCTQIMRALHSNALLCVRIVDADESQSLNREYRGHDRPTNVLSFPAEIDNPDHQIPVLGDLLICAPIIAAEAMEQGKPLAHHWQHMLVHGILHLMGYDHQLPDEQAEMEAQEITLLAQMGVPDPYWIG